MAEESDSLVVQILRNVQGVLSQLQRDVAELKRDVASLDARVGRLEDSNALALGYIAQMNMRHTRTDRDVVLLHNRVTMVELTVGVTPQQ